jgi:hypothetical protein
VRQSIFRNMARNHLSQKDYLLRIVQLAHHIYNITALFRGNYRHSIFHAAIVTLHDENHLAMCSLCAPWLGLLYRQPIDTLRDIVGLVLAVVNIVLVESHNTPQPLAAA